MVVFSKLLAIFFSLLILLQAGLVRYLVGTWIFPACLFALFWFAVTFIPLVVLFTVPVEPTSVAYILLCCLVFSATALSLDWRRAFAKNRLRKFRPTFGSAFIRLAFYGTTLVALLCLAVNIHMQGYSLDNIIFHLMTTSSEYITRRYNDALDVNVFGRLSVVLTYTSAVLGGMYYVARSQGSRGSIVILFMLIPSAAVMVVQGAKGTLFLAVAYFIAGIMIAKIKNDDLSLIQKQNILTIVMYMALLMPVLVVSFMARGLYEYDDAGLIQASLIKGFLSYSSAHMYAFSDWFSHLVFGESAISYSDDFGAYGFHTFMSIFRLFGSDKYVPPGYYGEYFIYDEILQTNIYTMFRGLIYDFGLLGSIIFMVPMGLIIHIAFWQLLVGRRPIIAASIFAHSIGFFYTSFLISQFVWNSIYASFIMVIAFLYVNDLVTGKAKSIYAHLPRSLS